VTAPNGLLAHLGAALLAGGLAAAGYRECRPGGAVRARFLRQAARIDAELAFLRYPGSGRGFALMQAGGCAAALAAACALETWPLAAFAVSVLAAPRFWLERRRVARVLALEQQLADWLLGVSGAVLAGNSLAEALRSSAALAAPPLRDEIEQTMREFALGAPLDRALEALAERVGSRVVTSAVFILGMGRETGGDLPTTLSRAAGSLREMARLEGVVRSKTAEGKAQAFVISIIPVPLVAAIDWMNPGYFAPLLSGPVGYAVLGAAAALWCIAIVAAASIVEVDV
jgi:tight adherence protein B